MSVSVPHRQEREIQYGKHLLFPHFAAFRGKSSALTFDPTAGLPPHHLTIFFLSSDDDGRRIKGKDTFLLRLPFQDFILEIRVSNNPGFTGCFLLTSKSRFRAIKVDFSNFYSSPPSPFFLSPFIVCLDLPLSFPSPT